MVLRRTVALALLLAACGGEPTREEDPVGTPIGMSPTEAETAGGEEQVPATAGSVELALRRADGTFIDVGELRGARVLLVVLATFDGTSQMLLRPLREIAEQHPDLTMVGIAAEPSARLLIGPYETALEPPFPMTYDPEEQVREGTSPLGELEAVPTVILLDEQGVESGRLTGFVRTEALEALLTQ